MYPLGWRISMSFLLISYTNFSPITLKAKEIWSEENNKFWHHKLGYIVEKGTMLSLCENFQDFLGHSHNFSEFQSFSSHWNTFKIFYDFSRFSMTMGTRYPQVSVRYLMQWAAVTTHWLDISTAPQTVPLNWRNACHGQLPGEASSPETILVVGNRGFVPQMSVSIKR